MPMSKITNLFAVKGFSVQEMVALSDAHTTGFSHGGSKDQMVEHMQETKNKKGLEN